MSNVIKNLQKELKEFKNLPLTEFLNELQNPIYIQKARQLQLIKNNNENNKIKGAKTEEFKKTLGI